ncbi:hypothetical protein G9A89_013548, partial [Geosiphon pyriformis]
MNNVIALKTGSAISFDLPVLDVLDSTEFLDMHSSLLDVWFDRIEVYTDGFLKSAGSAKMTCGAVAYFPATNVSIGIRVFGLLSSTLAELQTIALALECVPASCNVALYSDSQSVINACVSETSLTMSDFCINKVTVSSLTLPVGIWEQFLVAKDTAVSVVHKQLPMAVKKRLYDKNYSGVLCLLCSEMELPDHVFTYSGDTVFQKKILVETANKWTSLT